MNRTLMMRRVMMSRKLQINKDDIDYVYIDTSELKFMIVKKNDDGNDIAFRADNISLSTLAIDDLIDDAYRHIQEHGEIIVDDDSEEINITFTGEE
jgi:hypothetical protein